jgi:hypothetical protein
VGAAAGENASLSGSFPDAQAVGYGNERAQRVVFDIETYALDDAADYVEPTDLDACRAQSNRKAPTKIELEIARQKAELLTEHQTKLDRCALDWNLSRVVAIGYWLEANRT